MKIQRGSLYALVLFPLLIANAAFSEGGHELGNGGDICEDRIKMIRDDISSWINKGGPAGLQLPVGINLSQYSDSMLKAISQAKVSCTSKVVTVGSTEKTCKNYFDGGIAKIVCNAKRFTDTGESGQYVLIHHEYAGLADIEMSTGEESNYNVSNQISAFLVDEVVKKLAIKPAESTPIQCSLLDHSKSISVGTKCLTSKGASFERVSRDRLGEAWKDPDGVIWGDEISISHQDVALEVCQSMGFKLPALAHFIRGEVNGFREVLPHMTAPRGFWTSTASPDDSFGTVYMFFAEDGSIGKVAALGMGWTRCILTEN